MKCKVIGCGRSDKSCPGLHFYRFPKDPVIRQEWIRACVLNEEEVPFFKVLSHTRLCSVHFPNGKQNPDNTWNIPVHVEWLDEEWQEMDTVENHDDMRPIDKNEVNSLEACLRSEIFRLRQKVIKLKRYLMSFYQNGKAQFGILRLNKAIISKMLSPNS